MYRGHTISVVVPCHNEEAGLPRVMQEMPEIVDEVIVVANNSQDRTAEVAHSYGALVVHEPRQGYGAACQAGFHRASGEYVVTLDGDGSYPAGFIPLILDAMLEEGLDFVTCDRTGHRAPGAGTPLRIFGNWVLGAVQTTLFLVPLRDSQSGMWAFRRGILPWLTLSSQGMAFSEELKIEAFTHPDVVARELPIYYRPRLGESKLHVWRDGLHNLTFLFRKRLALWRTRRPRASRVAPAAESISPVLGWARKSRGRVR